MVAMSLIISPTLLTLSLGLWGPSLSIQVITSLHPKHCRAGIHNGAPVPMTFCPHSRACSVWGRMSPPSSGWVAVVVYVGGSLGGSMGKPSTTRIRLVPFN